MDFVKTKRSTARRRNGKIEKDAENNIYSHRLQFYRIPPTDTVSLHEFEDFAVERLKVLKAVESAGEKFIKSSDSYETFLIGEIRKTKFGRLHKKQQDDDDDEEETRVRRLDHISHFILRLAYCRSEELRRWFLAQEMDLFRFRFQYDSSKESKQKFLELNNLHYEMISDSEKESIAEKLAAASNLAASNVITKDYFKVHFTEALDLVQKRKVYLERGQAYVQFDDMISLLLSVYRTHLNHALAVTARALPHLEEDDRLLPMLSSLSKRYLGSEYNLKKSTAGQVTADMIDMLSKKSFPPCMQQLHTSLRQNHHLKHGGRQQYGLFLKGIGLSLEEAMKFWRTEFTKLIDGDKFDKQYSYNIRHNYGKEGKRADYTPYSCLKVIMSNAPGPGDCHGCPFKHTDADLLKQKLKSGPSAVGDLYLDKIMSEVKTGRYNVACTRYFEAVHKLPLEYQAQAVSHPNQWYDESQRVLNGDNKGPSSGTPQRSQKSGSQMSQSTPRSQKGSQSQTGTQKTAIDEMDDDFDLAEVEKSMG